MDGDEYKYIGCNKHECQCAYPRCPVCNYKFVSAVNIVCDTCSPHPCEVCKKSSSIIYKRRISPKVDYRKIVGVKLRGNDVCKLCEDGRGDHNICYYCSKGGDEKLVCYNCLHKYCQSCGQFFEHIDKEGNCDTCAAAKTWEQKGFHNKKCVTCSRTLPVNEKGKCIRCHTVELSGGDLCENCGVPCQGSLCDSCIKQSKRCIECHKLYAATEPNQTHCPDCKPACMGCGNQFQPKTRTQVHCDTCLYLITNSKCVVCKKSCAALDQTGACISCRDDHGDRFFCKGCNINAVEKPTDMCESCAKRKRLCPSCYKVEIAANEMACESCLKFTYGYNR